MDQEELNDYSVKSSESSVKSLQSNHSKPPPPPPPSKAPRSLQELLASRNNNTRVVSPLSSGSNDAETSNPPSEDPILRSNTNPPPPLSSSVNLAVTVDEQSSPWNPPLSSSTAITASIPASSTPSTLQLKPIPVSSYLVDEYEEREQQELEMPSQSYQVLPDETDLMAILGGHLHQPSQSVDISQSITASQLSSFGSYQPPQHQQQQQSVVSNNDDVIELYSTIAMLKKENNELMRDLEVTKKTKEVQILELSNKLQNAVEDSRNLPQLKRELASANEMIQRLHEDIHVLENHREQQQFELHEKDELLSSMQSTKTSDLQTLRNDNNTMKMEINKLRMENSMNKVNQEKAQNECIELKKEISFLSSEQEKIIAIHNQEITNLKNDKRKLDDQCQMMRNDLNDKVSLIHQMANDITRLENSVNNLTMENNQLKQRLFSYELMERDLNNIKFHAGQLEQNNNQLQREVTSLRQQIQSLQNAAASMPPPSSMESLSSAGYNNNNYSYSSYGGGGGAATSASSAVPSVTSSTMSAGSSYSPRPMMTSHSYSSLPPERPPAAMPMSGSQKNAPRSLSSALGHDFPDRSMPPPSSAGQGGGGSSGPSSLSTALGGRKNVGSASFGGGAPGGNNSSSLASLLTNHGLPPQQAQGSGSAKHVRSSPFATEETAASIMSQFEVLERDLTGLMSEKTMLQDEAEKLQVRGLKTVRDRSRLQQVERRLDELSKDISSLRLKLTSKPG